MANIEAFSLDYADKVILTQIRGMYPRMKFSRLINMILREWLEMRDKQTKGSIPINELQNLIDQHTDGC